MWQIFPHAIQMAELIKSTVTVSLELGLHTLTLICVGNYNGPKFLGVF